MSVVSQHRAGENVKKPAPQDTQTRSRLLIGEFGPSDSALAAARGWRLRRAAADRHAARCASRGLCSGARPSTRYALEGADGDDLYFSHSAMAELDNTHSSCEVEGAHAKRVRQPKNRY